MTAVRNAFPGPGLANLERWSPLLIAAIFVTLGLARLEDRSILEVGGSAGNAMAAIASLSSDEEAAGAEEDQAYITPIAQASALSRRRARNIMRDGATPRFDIADVTSPFVSRTRDDFSGASVNDGADPIQAFAIVDDRPQIVPLSSLSLARNSGGIFVANAAPLGAVPGGSGGGTPGSGSGGESGGEGLVPAVPEPSTWMLILLGFFMLGSAVRRNNKMKSASPVLAHSGS